MQNRSRIFIALFSALSLLFYLQIRDEETSWSEGSQTKADFKVNENDFDEQAVAEFVTRYPNVTEDEKERFMVFQEAKYTERRDKISGFCIQQPTTLDQRTYLLYLHKKKISYCLIPKVSTSTWCSHFRQIWTGGKLFHEPGLWPCYTVPRFPAKATDSDEFWIKSTSLVIVRHPFSRLSSLYYQKFVGRNVNFKNGGAGWENLNQYIIRRFRSEGISEEKYNNTVTPEEMLNHVISTLKPGKISARSPAVDIHWKPQFLSCPFCSRNFTIYAKLEEIHQDTVYFMLKTGEKGLEIKLRQNQVGSRDAESRFWSMVSSATIEVLQEPWAYGTDLELFGYSVDKYFNQLQQV